jgi:hypothetical protein
VEVPRSLLQAINTVEEMNAIASTTLIIFIECEFDTNLFKTVP